MSVLALARDRLASGAELGHADRRVLLAVLQHVDARQVEARLRVEGRREGTRLVRELAQAHYRHLASVKAKARAISAAATRYATPGWTHDRAAATCPPRLHGRPEAYLWAMMKACPAFPFSVRALEDILK